MNFFATDEYLETAAETFFPNEKAEAEYVKLGKKVYRTLVTNQKNIIDRLMFLDYMEEISDVDIEDVQYETGTLESVKKYTIPAKEWLNAPLRRPYQPAPIINLSLFNSTDAFIKYCRTHSSSTFKNQRNRKLKTHLEPELGPVRYKESVDIEEAKKLLPILMDWKEKQFKLTTVTNIFKIGNNRQFITKLVEKKLLELSVMYAGDTPLAIQGDFRYNKTMASAISGYDRNYSRYSPGILLLEDRLLDAIENGYTEFNFMGGAEPYKFRYATHVHVTGPSQINPLAYHVTLPIRNGLIMLLKKTRIYSTLKRLQIKHEESF